MPAGGRPGTRKNGGQRQKGPIGSAAKRRREAAKAGKPLQQPRGPIGKQADRTACQYMTRDAAKRLRLAKMAAAEILVAGGSRADAAKAAQAFGSSCGGSSSSSDGEADDGGGVEREQVESTILPANSDAPGERSSVTNVSVATEVMEESRVLMASLSLATGTSNTSADAAAGAAPAVSTAATAVARTESPD
eukprot:COSAG02_NODE_2253_length_9348_cov_21.784842_5_plen_192_part_00